MTASSASARERKRAAIGTAAFAVAPATVAGVVPWLLTRWEVEAPVPGGIPAQISGALLIGAGAAVIANSFVHFAAEGIGTPAPFAPPRQLVVGGLYRYVRNPMYVSIAAAIAGQGLLLGQPKLFVALGIGAVPVVAFVRLYEEPALTRKFGAVYEEYRRNVPRWLPRLTPWRREGAEPSRG
ncbi:protein-S-isoprenylcysteine O-methyltransferase Ste14 [Arthrobacter sp. V4I6]|uniref:methyltransferase family protein n=1 Tax=unclassified Arthrobacter TaxID=235627 RepID=UPI00277E989C|nr:MULTISPECIES: isoprenylcysteine carboxylmethyltransferase family protein [unclassified Arthrobacter]MDQ0822994.1 protein-S-isoprenylcysteine O-methyltransferase Ste14 [Arthrobacter sp. V1I7]MDQ0852622.1 protein-S-isoprenylcysteine O-methyltransferase Ste14 [Arthrobacter sp. V4I6]